ncbi:MAG: permease-like cell division protein FtsX [Candidatus Pacebacteria bacterium]|nr:permease-like cell division protein FtsX [Candidatus Paceibacterota bacterium]
MFTSFKRILKFGWQGFWRNKTLSLQVIFIMGVVVFAISFIFLFEQIGNFLITQSEEKVDISVYFKKDATEEAMLNLKQELLTLTDQVKSVDYISKKEANEIFIEKHKDDKFYMEALDQVQEDPFLASLNIKAFSSDKYAFIDEFLKAKEPEGIIEKVSYSKNKEVINQLFYITSNVKKAGFVGGIGIALLVILITFNTIKLTIISIKDEITTSRLVGASSWFIRGPFLVQSILYAIASVIIFDAIFAGCVIFLNDKMQTLFLDFNLVSVLKSNGAYLLLAQIACTIFLGSISSFLASRKYLKM